MKFENNKDILKELFLLQDLKYKNFYKRLIPNLSDEKFIGIPVPVLRKFAKDIFQKNPNHIFIFLNSLPHQYYEEDNLHCFLIENMKNFQEVLKYTNLFLPYIDNWATCDSFSPKIFKKYPEEILLEIKKWLNSQDIYTVRFAIGLLLSNYLDKYFKKEILELVASINSKEYYINMMIAWFFATALAKQYSFTIPYLEKQLLNPWVHKKTIQKSCESRRFSLEQKKYFKTLFSPL
ncbi:DNA alkylation repair protein [Cetobacterium ceti]